jgi:hypothetical protein
MNNIENIIIGIMLINTFISFNNNDTTNHIYNGYILNDIFNQIQEFILLQKEFKDIKEDIVSLKSSFDKNILSLYSKAIIYENRFNFKMNQLTNKLKNNTSNEINNYGIYVFIENLKNKNKKHYNLLSLIINDLNLSFKSIIYLPKERNILIYKYTTEDENLMLNIELSTTKIHINIYSSINNFITINDIKEEQWNTIRKLIH